jgi:hypothetical protein
LQLEELIGCNFVGRTFSSDARSTCVLVAGARLIRSRHASLSTVYLPRDSDTASARSPHRSATPGARLARAFLAVNAGERHARDPRRDRCCREDQRILGRTRPAAEPLAPDLVEAIPGGKQPVGVTLAVLMRPFSLEWHRQHSSPRWAKGPGVR